MKILMNQTEKMNKTETKKVLGPTQQPLLKR